MRALFIVLDNLGVGHIPNGNDAPAPDTLGRLLDEVPELELPTLYSLGLGEIMKCRVFDPPARKCGASYGRMIQRSAGADSLSGFWELAGVIPGCPFTITNQLTAECTAALSGESGTEFLINPSNDAASLFKNSVEQEKLRKEHLRTGSPILTFTADSLLHIAAHESVVPANRLAQICRTARHLCDSWRIARVRGQLLTGKTEAWRPTSPPLMLPMVPPRSILNAISDRGLPVEAVGAIADAFARSGITRTHPTASDAESLAVIEQLWRSPQNGVIFTNLEMSSSIPNSGSCIASAMASAHALETFDAWLTHFLEEIESDNLLIIAGSNGSGQPPLDSYRPRQDVPVLVRYGGRTSPLGIRETFADIAATLGTFFDIEENGRAWTVGEPLITFHRPRGFAGP